MLQCVDTMPGQAAATHVILKWTQVGGVTSLGNDVFVVCKYSQQIEVYDAVTFTRKRCLAVPGLGTLPYGLAVCPINNCLYASDWNSDSVHRVQLSGSNAVMKWSVARCPVGLTVNRAQNLLVVSVDESKLQEFTTYGTLIRNIQLQSDAGKPWHAIDVANGEFVISCRKPLYSVCLVDSKGAVTRRYGGQRGCRIMDYVAGLAVDKRGNILVADTENDRLLVLDSSLSSAHEMSVSVNGGLKNPTSLWYDKSRGRLYIGEWRRDGGGRVIVVDDLYDFSASCCF